MRVPLLNPIDVVFQQLLPADTQLNTPGGGLDGYDPDLREPREKQVAGGQAITATTVYGAEVKVPCQLETKQFEELHMLAQGDASENKVTVVLHRRDLTRLGLIEALTGRPTIKKGDKALRFEKRGAIVLQFAEPLYVHQIAPGSAGFGPDGYDLEIVWLACQSPDVTGRG
jgi:hypothetical protein